MTSDFKLLEEQFAPHHIGNRTESTAMLAWLLEHGWRLDPDDVQQALCDGSNDKGIDAITVDTTFARSRSSRRSGAGRRALRRGKRISSAFAPSPRTFEDPMASTTSLRPPPIPSFESLSGVST